MKLLSTTGLGLATAMAAGLVSSATAETELTMYYPIAVGGSLTEVVDGIVADTQQGAMPAREGPSQKTLGSQIVEKPREARKNGIGKLASDERRPWNGA